MPYCRLGKNYKQIDCYFEHPYGRDIDNQQLFINELIEKIDSLLSIAEEQLQKTDDNDEEYNGSDDERDTLEELRSQKYEFQSAINRLTTEFNSILSSGIYNNYERIQKQLERELKRWQSRLPIYARRSDIIKKLKTNQVFILKADTGSGKSTQIVQYLCDEHFADQSIQVYFKLLMIT